MLYTVPSSAEVTLNVIPNGIGSFLLVGDHVVGVSAFDIMIDYDSFHLVNPSVRVEGGAVTDIDANTSGKLFVSINRDPSNAAFYIMLSFENRGIARGGKGINYVVVTSGDSGDKTPLASDATVTSLSSSSTLSVENGSREYTRDISSAEGARRIDEGKGDYQKISNDSPETSHYADKRTVSSFSEQGKSVLQRFIEFKGEKNLQSFAALFERSNQELAKQYPSIALSDGKTPVTIKLELQQEGNGSPDIAVWDATLVFLHKDGAKNWTAKIVPSEGACEAKLIFKVNSEVIAYPVAVAPMVELAGNVNEQNFLAALNDYLSVQDASYAKETILPLSEYIFTANYLARQRDFSSKKELR